MNFMFTKAKADLLSKQLDFGLDDLRMLLVMTNTTIATQEDIATLGAATVLDEFVGAGYTSPGVAMTTKTVQQDNINNRGEFHADNVAFGALGTAVRAIQGAVLYKFVTSLALSQPIAYIDTGGFPLVTNGAAVTVIKHAEGWVQTT